MGANGSPRPSKKRYSPQKSADSEGEHSRIKRSRVLQEAGNKTNTQDGSQKNRGSKPRLSLLMEQPSALGVQPPECGIMTRIYCENFMCHRKLTVDLCRNVNFIYGQNGSGKSAILAAIQICLGAGARRTHRARNLKDLVRKDSTAGYAKVRVTLLNKGDDAYKHDTYGDQITVERTIATRGGYNGYKLYDVNMQEQSRKKSDLDELLDKVNVQVENPVAILDQEEAKKFLCGKAEDKYAFFMKATELERVGNSVQLTLEKISELTDQEDRMTESIKDDFALVQETKKQYEQHKEIERLKSKLDGCHESMAWAMFQEANQTLESEQEQFQRFREKANKKKEELTQDERTSQEGDSEEMSMRLRLEELNKEAEYQAKMKHDLEKDLKRVVEPKKVLERDLKRQHQEQTSAERNLHRAIQRLEDKRKEIVARAGSAESEEVLRTERLRKAEENLASAKAKYDEKKQEVSDLLRKSEEVEPHVEQARSNVKNAEGRLSAMKNRIHGLESSAGNSLNMFGPRCAQVKKEIELLSKQGRFQAPVLGPIGAYVKVNQGKEDYASLAELAMGFGTLDRFVVTNDRDRKLLQSIRRRVGCQSDCGIFQVAPHSKYNIPGPPVSGIETVASVLNISNDVIFNCLVDNCKIEEQALARSKEESEEKLLVEQNGKYSIKGKIKNAFFLPNGDNWSLSKGTLRMVANERRLRQTIGVDKSAVLEETKREVELIRDELSAMKRDESRLEIEHTKIKRAWGGCKRELQEVKVTINTMAQEIDSIKAEQDTAENFDTDTSDLEQDVAEVQELLSQIKERESQIKEEIAEKEPRVQELKERLEEVKARNMKVMKDVEDASIQLTTYMASLSQREEKLEKKRAKLQQYQEIIEKQEARVQEIQADVRRYLKHARRLAFARCKREEVQNLEREDALEIDESQFTQEPTNEELGAIEVVRVDRESTYYRARGEKLKKKIEDEKRRRNATKEDVIAAYEKYERARNQYDSKKVHLEEVQRTKDDLNEDVERRKERWMIFRKHIADKTSIAFDGILNQKGSSGKVAFDFANGTLDLIVQKDSSDANSQQKDVKALSGGERSYTTIALLLALGESLETPFRILDEFDVFLDPITRKLTIKSLITMAKSMSHRQFVFITPQDVSDVETDPMLKVLKMTPPARNNVVGGPSQQTLEFSQS